MSRNVKTKWLLMFPSLCYLTFDNMCKNMLPLKSKASLSSSTAYQNIMELELKEWFLIFYFYYVGCAKYPNLKFFFGEICHFSYECVIVWSFTSMERVEGLCKLGFMSCKSAKQQHWGFFFFHCLPLRASIVYCTYLFGFAKSITIYS